MNNQNNKNNLNNQNQNNGYNNQQNNNNGYNNQNQNNSQQNNGYNNQFFNQNGYSTPPNATYGSNPQTFEKGQFGMFPVSPSTQYTPQPETRFGSLIASIILFIIGLGFIALSVFVTLDFLEGAENIGILAALGLIFLGVGALTYLPAFACLGAGIFTSIRAISSSKTAVKVFAILFLILNIIALFGIIAFGCLIFTVSPT